jgi:hypothetical protein
MRTHLCAAAAAALVALASPSFAEQATSTSTAPSSSGRLSAFGGEPLPSGQSLLHLQFGWPSVSATFLHGVGQKITAGGRFAFNYGFEGATGGAMLGLKFQGYFRLGLLNTGKVSLGLDMAPGVMLYFPPGPVSFGLTVPVSLVMGIPLSPAFSLHLAMEMPMSVTLTSYSSFFIPLYFGGGLEYALDRSLLLTFALRMGPLIDTRLSSATFGLNALFGVAFKV